MKHELEVRLRAEARRELREAPAGIAARVHVRLLDAPREQPGGSRLLPFALAAGLAAAALLACILWPRTPVPAPRIAQPPAEPSAPALAVDLTRKGIQFAARIDRPLADEWQRIVQDSLQLCDSLLGQLPTLPR
jgi:hypothetical protein